MGSPARRAPLSPEPKLRKRQEIWKALVRRCFPYPGVALSVQVSSLSQAEMGDLYISGWERKWGGLFLRFSCMFWKKKNCGRPWPFTSSARGPSHMSEQWAGWQGRCLSYRILPGEEQLWMKEWRKKGHSQTSLKLSQDWSLTPLCLKSSDSIRLGDF